MEGFWNSVIRTQCACVYKDDIWYFSNEINALLRMDRKTMDSQFVTSFPNCEISRGWLFTEVIPYADSLVFVPYMAKDIVVYYPERNMHEVIPLNRTDNQVYFITNYVDENVLLLFPAVHFECYYIFDLQSKKLVAHRIDLTDIFCGNKSRTISCFANGAYKKGYFYTNILKDNELYRINIKDGEICNVVIDGEIVNSTCFFDDTQLVMLNAEGDKILLLDVEGKKRKEYELKAKNRRKLFMCDEQMGFSDVKKISESRWLVLPVWGNDIVLCEEGNLTYIELDWERISELCDNAKVFSEMLICEEYIYLFPYQATTIVRLDLKQLRLDYGPKSYLSGDEIRAIANYYNGNQLFREDTMRLKTYFRMVNNWI